MKVYQACFGEVNEYDVVKETNKMYFVTNDRGTHFKIHKEFFYNSGIIGELGQAYGHSKVFKDRVKAEYHALLQIYDRKRYHEWNILKLEEQLSKLQD